MYKFVFWLKIDCMGIVRAEFEFFSRSLAECAYHSAVMHRSLIAEGFNVQGAWLQEDKRVIKVFQTMQFIGD